MIARYRAILLLVGLVVACDDPSGPGRVDLPATYEGEMRLWVSYSGPMCVGDGVVTVESSRRDSVFGTWEVGENRGGPGSNGLRCDSVGVENGQPVRRWYPASGSFAGVFVADDSLSVEFTTLSSPGGEELVPAAVNYPVSFTPERLRWEGDSGHSEMAWLFRFRGDRR